ncbi:MAG: Asp-tRNA(Asn)/Glu-tRNA(Gln) amidotransferase subunit GatC [Clostridia bacterium]|nr:Asp-tRNA(Asn)/Glu-tRNA(Gln) amidotransferase subunit GatC [Clostridia bacterium]
MKISKEEILRIAELASLKIDEGDIEEYILNLQDILNFANIVNKVDTSNIDTTIGASEDCNIFRKDEIIEFENKEGLLRKCTRERKKYV